MRVLTGLGVTFAVAALLGCGGSSTTTDRSSSGAAAENGSGTGGSSAAPREGASPPSAYPLHAGFSADPVTAEQRAQLAEEGQTELRVRVGKAGTVSAFGQAEIGESIERVANATPQAASGTGAVSLTLRLTPVARKALAEGHSFLMYVAVRYSGDRTAQRIEVPLTPQG